MGRSLRIVNSSLFFYFAQLIRYVQDYHYRS